MEYVLRRPTLIANHLVAVRGRILKIWKRLISTNGVLISMDSLFSLLEKVCYVVFVDLN